MSYILQWKQKYKLKFMFWLKILCGVYRQMMLNILRTRNIDKLMVREIAFGY